MKVAILPIRSGSKRVKDKNIRDFCGEPLFYWTVIKLKKLVEIGLLDSVIISSDSPGYLEMAKQYFGFPELIFSLRDPEYAKDYTTTEATVIYELEKHKIREGMVLIVEAASPLIPVLKLKEMITDIGKYDSTFVSSLLVSVEASQRWEKNNSEIHQIIGQWSPLCKSRLMSQDDTTTYKEIGAWAINVQDLYSFKNRVVFPWQVIEVPQEFSLSINSEYDFICAEALFKYSKVLITKEL